MLAEVPGLNTVSCFLLSADSLPARETHKALQRLIQMLFWQLIGKVPLGLLNKDMKFLLTMWSVADLSSFLKDPHRISLAMLLNRNDRILTIIEQSIKE